MIALWPSASELKNTFVRKSFVEQLLLTSRPVVASINLSALRWNARAVRRMAPGCSVYAAIKANGYGHGALNVADALSELVDGFAVIETDAAIAIRNGGFGGPILVLEGFYESSDLDAFSTLGLEAVVHSSEQVEWVGSYGGPMLRIWLKVDTGMHRLGLSGGEMSAALARLRDKDNVKLCGVMSHLADVDDSSSVAQQLSRFESLSLPRGIPRSLASSGAVLNFPAAHNEWVRPGLMLYGASPFRDSTGADWGLQPAMTFRSRVISIVQVEKGEAVGYGRTFVAPGPMRVANVAGGYADGYPLGASTGTPILVDGVPSRTLGRVSMDKLCVDVSGIAHAKVGSDVTFWGPELPVEVVARSVGSSPYALLTGLSHRVPIRAM